MQVMCLKTVTHDRVGGQFGASQPVAWLDSGERETHAAITPKTWRVCYQISYENTHYAIEEVGVFIGGLLIDS